MGEAGKIKYTCWKCGKTYEVSRRQKGKIFECTGCGEKNMASDTEALRRADFESRNRRCPTCERWVRNDADECFNCGRPFRDQAALEDVLKREPEIKAALARTVSETYNEPETKSYAWLALVALAAAIVLVFGVIGYIIARSGD
jgi:DNA-directed RNA polymerase subunit RPC12/RpoP